MLSAVLNPSHRKPYTREHDKTLGRTDFHDVLADACQERLRTYHPYLLQRKMYPTSRTVLPDSQCVHVVAGSSVSFVTRDTPGMEGLRRHGVLGVTPSRSGCW